MKSVFDACCNTQQSVDAVRGQPTTTSVTQTTATTTYAATGETQQVDKPPRHGQGMANLLTKVEEKVPMVAPITSTMRGAIQTGGTGGGGVSAPVGPQFDRLNSNVITGRGEVSDPL
jgi:hypothetical protein